ncbi:MAG: hypothetical protein A3C84_04215 [Candidatus Ryanbacteria bacterium RIFCSPHIGHO2_02_FULL_48_12]|uniref:YCII-related domain-containing protein n=1 Tax=Candidatus Ryanbacteria bacterium RIFCSPHIGHO2_01_FULL_48_27 TaxID=1802115 RepID=A0A1G2G6J7_9BACT|nr:MAG: hypothetical protein A2756_00740 [Candidatus Ryanbacteria bacterium RIFCSPHIGHO2_01_FULL_48_27]OGZ48568.1 MAG: hypothetical protein A3C84_04215 [Candidatus Ryanbacteria bacterium RIFCSPHIGHO2_02_FULL_48_12]
MKKFLAIYLGSANAMARWRAADEETRKAQEKAGMEAWMQWATTHKDAIVDMGAPLGKTKRIDKGGISDTKNEIGAYTVVQAESHEEAAKLFLDHPHFVFFPGESIELMECLPLPKMQ